MAEWVKITEDGVESWVMKVPNGMVMLTSVSATFVPDYKDEHVDEWIENNRLEKKPQMLMENPFGDDD